MMPAAANEATFDPPALHDPTFFAWAIRVGLRLKNKPPGLPAGAIERAILIEGTPCPEWAEGLAFLISLANAHKRETASG